MPKTILSNQRQDNDGAQATERSETATARANGQVTEAAIRIKDELLALLAHELRSPLGAVRNALDIWRDCDEDAAMRSWVRGVLDRQTAQMVRLIEEAVAFSRGAHHEARLIKQPLDVGHLMDWAVETVRPCMDEHEHVLEIRCPTEPVIVEADPTQLQQVLVNLLTNAAKYTCAGGRVWLTAELADSDIVLRVQDTGIGIAPEALPHVFDLFWQSPSAAGHADGGRGIGLALVRQIIETHGGSVSVFSAGLGQGSEFVVRLPKATTTAAYHSEQSER